MRNVVVTAVSGSARMGLLTPSFFEKNDDDDDDDDIFIISLTEEEGVGRGGGSFPMLIGSLILFCNYHL